MAGINDNPQFPWQMTPEHRLRTTRESLARMYREEAQHHEVLCALFVTLETFASSPDLEGLKDWNIDNVVRDENLPRQLAPPSLSVPLEYIDEAGRKELETAVEAMEKKCVFLQDLQKRLVRIINDRIGESPSAPSRKTESDVKSQPKPQPPRGRWVLTVPKFTPTANTPPPKILCTLVGMLSPDLMEVERDWTMWPDDKRLEFQQNVKEIFTLILEERERRDAAGRGGGSSTY
jgi:hypothetical protein